MKKFVLSLLAVVCFTAFTSDALAQVTITDDGSGTGTTTWTNDNVYILDGFVFVNEGQVLTIQEGTVIKGKPGTGADASALIVARGGQIMAEGTAEAPIVFTFEGDPLDGSTPYSTRGQWGGLILLGGAQLNSSPGETQIEGIPETEPRGLYGGENDQDYSGIIKYLSIRHGGTDIGAGNEINGLTLGGVGSSTVIEHIEIISNADDGIEFFGGTASVKWASVAFCSDDSFDYDEGWRGKGQFWFTVQDDSGDGQGDRGGEHDGGTNPEDGAPYAHPVIYNCTYMGRGIAAGKRALTFRDNAGGEYHNSIFFNWGKGIDVENLASGEDSYARFVAGDLIFEGNCFYETAVAGSGATASDLFKISMGSGWASDADSIAELTSSSAALQASFAPLGNEVTNPELNYMISEGSGELIPVPGVTLTGTAPTGNWYENVSFKGAFDPSESCSWLSGWTMLDNRGFIGCADAIDESVAVDRSLNVYPNPSSSFILVDIPAGVETGVLNILSLDGKIIAQETIQAGGIAQTINLNTAGLDQGLYLIQLKAANHVLTQRFVKK